jgi:hypothetical protein
MQWMIFTQAFLLATWGIFVQKFEGANCAIFSLCSVATAIIGIVFAIGSLLSIKAAHDEIEWLRANYLVMFPQRTSLNLPLGDRTQLCALAGELKPYLWLNTKPFEHDDASEIKNRLANDPLPGLTGSKNFHLWGHVVPRYMPVCMIVIWLGVFVVAIGTSLSALLAI